MKILLTVTSIFTLLVGISVVDPAPAAKASSTVSATFRIDGMGCPSCAKEITKALKSAPGVESAAVKYREGEAVVQYDPAKVTTDQLVHAIERASNAFYTYRAKPLAEKSRSGKAE